MEEKELQDGSEGSQPEPEHAAAAISEAPAEAAPEVSGQMAADEAELPAPAGEEAAVSVDELLAPSGEPVGAAPLEEAEADLRAILEAVVYIAEEPLTVAQMAAALGRPAEAIQSALNDLIAEFEKPEHGIAIREVAGGYKIATKAEHHEAVRNFVKSLNPPLKLSLPALETLAVIAYKQPVTGPEIMEIRGVQGGGVLKTLLDRKLIAVGGRKNVIGKPMLYKTTKEFLIQFGLKDLSELPSLKEFEEIRRMAFSDAEPAAAAEPVEAAETEASAGGAIDASGDGASDGKPAASEAPEPSEPAQTAAAETESAPPEPASVETQES
jgi:segregation and condensation protein B